MTEEITLEDLSIEQLQNRNRVAHMLIKMMEQDGDEMALAAADKLRDQQRQINEVLVRKIGEQRTEEPPPVVVGVKTLRVTGRAPSK